MADFKGITMCSWNVRGVNHPIKRKKILNVLKKEHVHIAFLQESHLSDIEHEKFKREWIGQIYYSSYTSKSRGVIILMHKNVPFIIEECVKDKQGRYILVKGSLYGESIVLGNIYAPNNFDVNFFMDVFSKVKDFSCANVILGGDLNSVWDIKQDRSHVILSHRGPCIKEICKEFDLLDIETF